MTPKGVKKFYVDSQRTFFRTIGICFISISQLGFEKICRINFYWLNSLINFGDSMIFRLKEIALYGAKKIICFYLDYLQETLAILYVLA